MGAEVTALEGELVGGESGWDEGGDGLGRWGLGEEDDVECGVAGLGVSVGVSVGDGH